MLYHILILSIFPYAVFNLKFNFFRKGYEIIWKTIVKKENLNIEFNQDIFAVERKFNKIILKLWKGTSFETVSCEFLIWAAPMKHFLRTVSDASHQEWSLFQGLKPEIFTASLVNVNNYISSVYPAYLPNINSAEAEEHGVMTSFNMREMQATGNENHKFLEEFSEVVTLSNLQLAKNKANQQELHHKLRYTVTKR